MRKLGTRNLYKKDAIEMRTFALCARLLDGNSYADNVPLPSSRSQP